MRCAAAADDDVARVLTKFLRTACIYCLVAKDDDDDWRAGKLSDPLSRDSLACGAVPACLPSLDRVQRGFRCLERR